MGKLLDWIDTFNRKERYFLFAQATGNGQHGLTLSAEFRAELGEALGLNIPEDAKGYIDYHLDWLHAAVLLARGTLPEGRAWANTANVATGKQEDIDLLVVYEADEKEWLVLVEAKGDSSWANKQLQSKEKRLNAIFRHEAITQDAKVQPRFCLMSPTESQGLVSGLPDGWPVWMLRPREAPGQGALAWLPLKMPAERKRVTRIGSDGSVPPKYAKWTVQTGR